MPHQRKLIRDAVVSMLTGATNAGASVYANRVQPLVAQAWRSELPGIVVYTMDETAREFNTAPREYMRTVQLMVEIQAEANVQLDDVLDAIADQVELVLMRDDTLLDTANDSRYVQTRQAIRDDGAKLIGACIIQFDVDYLDVRPDAGYAETLPDMTTVQTEFNLNNQQPDPDDRAKSIIEGLDQ